MVENSQIGLKRSLILILENLYRPTANSFIALSANNRFADLSSSKTVLWAES